MTWNIGSVVEETSKRVEVPSAISGTNMNNIVIGQINYIHDRWRITTGSESITEKYHEPLTLLTMSQVQRISDMDPNNRRSVKIGEFTKSEIKKNDSKDSLSVLWKTEADNIIKEIRGGRYGSYQSW